MILTSDLGQTDAPYSDEGMLQFAEALLKQGITEQELAVMMKQNPEKCGIRRMMSTAVFRLNNQPENGGIYGIKICDVSDRGLFGRSDMQRLETLENTYFLTNVWKI